MPGWAWECLHCELEVGVGIGEGVVLQRVVSAVVEAVGIVLGVSVSVVAAVVASVVAASADASDAPPVSERWVAEAERVGHYWRCHWGSLCRVDVVAWACCHDW